MSLAWKTRAIAEMNELADRAEKLRTFLLSGPALDAQVIALMQAQYGGMVAYYDALVARLRLLGVVDVETPPLVRAERDPMAGAFAAEMRGTPAAVEVTVTAPAGKRAEVCHGAGETQSMFTVTERQSQTWAVMKGERLAVRAGDVLEVAHKRDAS